MKFYFKCDLVYLTVCGIENRNEDYFDQCVRGSCEVVKDH